MRRCLTTLIIVGLSIMLGCTNSRPSPITEQEVNKFIADHDIREVAVEIMGEIAVVLFNEDKATGYYMLYKDKDGNLQDQMLNGHVRRFRVRPGHSASVDTVSEHSRLDPGRLGRGRTRYSPLRGAARLRPAVQGAGRAAVLRQEGRSRVL